jgi:hypothetical protein
MCYIYPDLEYAIKSKLITMAEYNKIKPCIYDAKEQMKYHICNKRCYLDLEYIKKYIICGLAYNKYVVLRMYGGDSAPSSSGDYQYQMTKGQQIASSFSYEP